jgi:serine/threonine protein kinase
MSVSSTQSTPRPETKELTTITVNDGISYITPDNLKSNYLVNLVKLSEGAFGEVYASGNNFAIKKFEKDYMLEELTKELNIYASVVHPCILRPIGWSAIDGVGYLVMPRGQKIENALLEGKITIENVVADTLSAIAYMNSLGFAHRDIKPGNMVYYDNKCMIIDMGLSIRAILNKDGNYYIKGVAYTSIYMDPEYFQDQYNNIRVEIYALGMSYKQIITNKLPYFGDLVAYESNIPHLDWFFSQATRLIESSTIVEDSRVVSPSKAEGDTSGRPSIQEILESAPKNLIPTSRRYTGTSFKENTITYNNYPKAQDFMRILMGWLMNVSYKHDLQAETVFLCFHLIHRSFEKILIKYSGATDVFQIFACVCLSLASIVTADVIIGLSTYKHLSIDTQPNYNSRYEQMTVDVLMALQGIISTVTYWNYAKSLTDLKLLLLDIMKTDYDPSIIREVTSGPSKCVPFRKIITLYEALHLNIYI